MNVNVNATLSQDGDLTVADAAVLAAVQEAVTKLGEAVAALQGTLAVSGPVDAGVPDTFPLPADQLAALTPAAPPPAPADYPLPAAQVAALTPSQPQTDALTDAQLRAAPLDVQDDYASVEHLEAQDGADGVLTFTASGPGQLVWIDVDPLDPTDVTAHLARATVDGSEPSLLRGWGCRPGANPLPVPMQGNLVKVWTPTGVQVAVQVVRRG